MSIIKVENLSFDYNGQSEKIFDNVSFAIDSNWNLGLIGRNGKGKTTFLKLLMNSYEYSGKIKSDVNFDYFPFEVTNYEVDSYEIARLHINDFQAWKLEKEVTLLNMDKAVLIRPFKTLSKGEQTKVLLAILFLKESCFLLIDEPTNHLDLKARHSVANYLKEKKGFILVSHDRNFLDGCIDHILSINNTNIEIQSGNFSSWYENKIRQDNYELKSNEKLKKEIIRLEKSALQTANWAEKIEVSKNNIPKDRLQDKGNIGHKSAKMMKRSISAQNRKAKAIQEKSKLLHNIETIEPLKMNVQNYHSSRIIEANSLEILYGNNRICKKINFYLERGERIHIKGKNGAGKSSIIKLILGQKINYIGQLYIPKDLKISYISQDTSFLKGTLKEFVNVNNLDESLFKTILKKLGFNREQYNGLLENYSEGQKKKILIAKSLCEEANVYVWDEPLNYIDIFTRIQLEELILNYKPTMIFVEHDEKFSDRIATKELIIESIFF